MAGNKALNRAARLQQDEFYTQSSDIEAELIHYAKCFAGKKILCNCDNPYESKFYRYFAVRFNSYRLAKLTASCYGDSLCAQIHEVHSDSDDMNIILEHDAVITRLHGNGDFRSPECIELLKESDIVVTNPPFSLFREFIALLIEHDKKFIVLGSKNAITYKKIFPLFMQNKIWLGINNSAMAFRVPDNYEPRKTRYWEEKDSDGRIKKWRSLGNTCWFTNLEHGHRHEALALTRSYEQSPELYPHYDNYDGIEVSRVKDIPYDYEGVMGVPITFMSKYNPAQFEIISYRKGNNGKDLVYTNANGRQIYPYTRILIRRK